jgi:hypothetical protein
MSSSNWARGRWIRSAALQQCHDLVWDRVEFKMLRFNRLAAPGDFTDNLKDIRRLP